MFLNALPMNTGINFLATVALRTASYSKEKRSFRIDAQRISIEQKDIDAPRISIKQGISIEQKEVFK